MDFDFGTMISADIVIIAKDKIKDCIKDSLIELTKKQIEYLKEYKHYADKTDDYYRLYNELSKQLYNELSKKWIKMHKIKYLKSPINCD